jgi:metallophosphoesterase superfamily enzyme
MHAMRVHKDWLLTPQRAALHLPTATAVLADLHLGYGPARCRRGEAVPDFGLNETISILGALRVQHLFRRVVIAGDFCEDGRLVAPASELIAWLNGAGIRLAAIIPGNHDRGLPGLSVEYPQYPEGFVLGGWRVVHGDGPLPGGKVVHGHVHPCLRWGRRLTAPCFLVGPERIILPAFSADAAGGSVIGNPNWGALRCFVPAGDRVLDFGSVNTLRKRARAKKSIAGRRTNSPTGYR